jgi:hypothetical protein
MRFVWMIILVLIPWVALAKDETLPVIARDLALLREDVGVIKEKMATKEQYQALYNVIQTNVIPELQKVESLDTWKDGHIKAHELLETGKDRSLVFWIGLITFILTAVTIGTNVILVKRNGNHAS